MIGKRVVIFADEFGLVFGLIDGRVQKLAITTAKSDRLYQGGDLFVPDPLFNKAYQITCSILLAKRKKFGSIQIELFP